ncbi:hypothetical protein [Paenarthrobacter sp. NPDC090522]|uniref:hypothetical protein n=1 Tax=Paenarthrobacter sp. NPDC090522 TaxID=3364383 RepID=UPI0037F4C83A
MRYVTLAADYLEPSIRDEVTGSMDATKWNLTPSLLHEVAVWNAEYQKIIPLDIRDRPSVAGLIDKLDSQGLELARRIGAELGSSTKVRYYSEGWLKLIEN